MHFWPFYCYFGPSCYFRCKMTKIAFLRPKKAKIKKSEESGPNFFYNFTWKYVPQLFLGAPWAEKMTLSFNFACFWSFNTSSHNLGVIWRWNQKRKSAGNFFSLDLPNGQAKPQMHPNRAQDAFSNCLWKWVLAEHHFHQRMIPPAS